MSAPMTRNQKTWWILANIVAWGGFALYQWSDFRRQDEASQRAQEYVQSFIGRNNALNEDFQRRLGCQTVNGGLGMCADPPCMDSDATGDADPRYVRGRVKTYEPVSILPHQTVEDACTGPDDLREATCNAGPDGGAPGLEWVAIHCEKGCRDGACIH